MTQDERDENSSGVCDYCEFVIPASLFKKCPRCRDQFAMAAPISLQRVDADSFEANAAARYQWADAMLEARKPLAR